MDLTRSMVFGFGFGAPGPLSSKSEKTAGAQVREGMWWKQEKNVTGFLTLANTTSQAVNATVEIEDSRGAVLGSHRITVPPQGMATSDLLEMQTAATNEGGIRVSYVGAPDALLVNGGVEDVGVGYSASLPFTTPERPLPPMSRAVTPQSIAELGLMAGQADPYMSFPAGTVFTPYSVLRNVSASPINVTPTLWWMQGSTPASFQLPSIRLLPSQTYTVDMPSLLAAAGLKDFSGSLNLILDTEGAPGLLMAAGSVDQTNTYVFEVAPQGIALSAGKNLSYWSIGNGDDTMVNIWNPADESQIFIFRLIFAGGHYDDVMTIGPRATAMFDISDIVRSAGADAEGNIIPAGTQQGSAKIIGIEAENQHLLLAVDSGIYNVRKATCIAPCRTCDGTTSYWVAVSPFGVLLNGQTQESLMAQWDTGMQYNYTNMSGTSWGSSDTSIATVQTGLVTGVGTGSISITSSTHGEPVYTQVCGLYAPSCPIAGGGGGSASGTVMPVPVNFRLVFAQASTNAGIIADYEWDSSSGNLSDLSNCTVSEYVTYPGNPTPVYYPPSPPYPTNGYPSPYTSSVNGALGETIDNNEVGSPFVKPYSTSSWSAIQYIRYSCNGSSPVILQGPLIIGFSVQQNGSGGWEFIHSKTGVGFSPTINPLP